MSYPRADLTGRRFGRLIAIEPARASYSGETQWACRCDCGAVHDVLTASLVRGATRSCGCLRRETASGVLDRRRCDLTGRRFGRLVALHIVKSTGQRSRWRCQCDCGESHVVQPRALVCGRTKSCGCLRVERGLATVAAARGAVGS